MSKMRIHKKQSYTIVPNNFLRNPEMSLKAKGLLTLLLSFPNDWEYTEEGLLGFFKDGKISLISGLKELETLGYLTRTRVKDSSGRFGGSDYDVYEDPGDRLFCVGENPRKKGAPHTQNPMTENPTQENPT